MLLYVLTLAPNDTRHSTVSILPLITANRKGVDFKESWVSNSNFTSENKKVRFFSGVIIYTNWYPEIDINMKL